VDISAGRNIHALIIIKFIAGFVVVSLYTVSEMYRERKPALQTQSFIIYSSICKLKLLVFFSKHLASCDDGKTALKSALPPAQHTAALLSDFVPFHQSATVHVCKDVMAVMAVQF